MLRQGFRNEPMKPNLELVFFNFKTMKEMYLDFLKIHFLEMIVRRDYVKMNLICCY